MSTIWDYHCTTCNETKRFLNTSLKLNFVASLHSMPSGEDHDPDKMEYSIHISSGSVKDSCQEDFGDTEVVKGSSDPAFKNVFSMNWTKDRKQHLCFAIKGVYRANKSVSVGSPPIKVCVPMDDYVAKGEYLKIELENGGSLQIQKVSPIGFKLAGMNIPRKDNFGGKSDPYVECYWRVGQQNDGDEVKFHTTKHIDDTESPVWEERITFKNYIKGGNMWFRFVMMDYDPASRDDLIGEVLLPVDDLVEAKSVQAKMSGDPKGQATLILVTVPPSKF